MTALHVSNGDSTDVPGTGLAQQVLYWRDSLHEGPVPEVGPEELRGIRARFLTEDLALLAERDRVLEAARDGEYVLWFEADLYDQLQIIQILDRLAGLGVEPERITLICIGEYPGIARFGGLGELTADQLRELPATKASAVLTSDALELAVDAWAAFRAPAPDRLAEIAARRSGELRFLGEAFDRLGREYPSTRDGLSLTERRVLAAVASGATDAGTAFVRAAARETRPYLGDTWCYLMMERLALAPVPLLTASDGRITCHTRLSLTDAGAQVLAGRRDHVGVDRWIGGVQLPGWRWDEGAEVVMPW
ncbi:hypothetical protein JNUCC0626_04630 [Lentzea sp. JNUCC 0626]|uniref:hypothetical protein n=1 Tax=Lentzea sp. JNUCC 0626 TaxID=3367513 RepID=UPI003748E5C0